MTHSFGCRKEPNGPIGNYRARQLSAGYFRGFGLAQVPVQRGGRFSANAIAPSFASFETNTGPRILTCSRHISAGPQPRDSTMIRLVAATASGPLGGVFSARASAASQGFTGSGG